MTWNAIVDEDSSVQILSAWIAKEELRTLLSTVHAGGDAHRNPYSDILKHQNYQSAVSAAANPL